MTTPTPWPAPHGIGYPNPLSEREIVLSTLVGEGQSDLLGAVGQEVDRLRESLNGWVGAGLEVNRTAGGLLAVLDALKDELSAGRQVHGSSTSSAIGVTEGSDAAGSMSPDSAASCHCGATSLDKYESYIAGADRNDRSRFDSFLIGWLLSAVDEETATRALDEAAAQINGGGS